MPKLFIVSLGCSKNLADAEVMAGELAAAGWELTADEDGADAALLNTCAFLGSAVAFFFLGVDEEARVRGRAAAWSVLGIALGFFAFVVGLARA